MWMLPTAVACMTMALPPTLEVHDVWAPRFVLPAAAAVMDLAWTADGDAIIALGDDGRLVAFELDGSPRWRRLVTGARGAIRVGDRTQVLVSVARGWRAYGLADGRSGHGPEPLPAALESPAPPSTLPAWARTRWPTLRATRQSPDGRLVARGDGQGRVGLYDAGSGSERVPVDGPHAAIRAVAVSPDGTTAASVDDGGALRLWDLASGSQRRHVVAFEGPALDVAWSPDGAQVTVVGGARGHALFRIADGQRLAEVAGAAGPLIARDDWRQPRRVVWLGEAEIAVALGSRVVERRAVATLATLATLATDKVPDAGGKIVDLASLGGEVVTLDHRGVVRWSAGGTPHRFSLEGKGAALGASMDGRRLVAATERGGVVVLDARAGTEVGRFETERGITAVALLLGDTSLVFTTNDGWLRVVDVASGTARHRAQMGHRPLTSLAVTRDGRVLTGSDDGGLRWAQVPASAPSADSPAP